MVNFPNKNQRLIKIILIVMLAVLTLFLFFHFKKQYNKELKKIQENVMNLDEIEKINDMDLPWKAGENDFFLVNCKLIV